MKCMHMYPHLYSSTQTDMHTYIQDILVLYTMIHEHEHAHTNTHTQTSTHMHACMYVNTECLI